MKNTYPPQLRRGLAVLLSLCLLPVMLSGQVTKPSTPKSAADTPSYRGGPAAGDDSEVVYDAALPVELISFAVEKAEGFAALNWVTVRESGVLNYTVETATDGVGFRDSEVVPARARNGELQVYSTKLPLPDGVRNMYYRLRITDVDGTEDFSAVRSLRLPTRPWTFEPLANPSSGSDLSLRLVGTDGPVSFSVVVHDMSGKPVYRKKHHSTSPTLALPLRLPAATYIVSLRGPDGSRVCHKVVLRP